ncbi:tRNA (adenosine(37)-N6)-threonylcarbamoyltransferase complex ATPase subunit type 1 TsaE [Anoxynatronum buryatiense]|uniref:tRNA threonylcarbamoyladenosine biosynthesis protein TsaE n=1 Tax=Anoxynatronum buryatiense TaxID=489973 RepID=A0AA45WYF0_9CLOT|nr:tRNA (adenosine(37)-N6)-threonylcarbamoyltransferase complex ATPase subunit type 1 TsaE [Anoxynatronum buryatiense]SMP67271.1 tRNA threonylcarbamoyladenosine biosynthesis protein TsaE [Anoxynatronum buryatiense]
MNMCRKVVKQSQTEAIAAKLATLLKPGDVVCLSGDLGAGKTTFTKALGKAMGIRENITSPTFNLVQEYDGDVPLYHFDVYRLLKPSEFRDLGAEEYFSGAGVCVIEWANLVKEYLPERHLWIEIKWLDASRREICITPSETFGNTLVKELGIT